MIENCIRLVINMTLLIEINVKQIASNKNYVRYKLKDLSYGLQLMVANSGMYYMTDNDYQQGILLFIIQRGVVALVNQSSMYANLLSNQITFKLTNDDKII